MKRPEEITTQYLQFIGQHLDDLVQNKATEMLEIADFAALLFIHPTHLTNTIQATVGISACGIFQLKTMERAVGLLADPSHSIQDVALQLTYEPSVYQMVQTVFDADTKAISEGIGRLRKGTGKS